MPATHVNLWLTSDVQPATLPVQVASEILAKS